MIPIYLIRPVYLLLLTVCIPPARWAEQHFMAYDFVLRRLYSTVLYCNCGWIIKGGSRVIWFDIPY